MKISVFYAVFLAVFSFELYGFVKGDSIDDLKEVCRNYKMIESELEHKLSLCNVFMNNFNPSSPSDICSYFGDVKQCMEGVVDVLKKCDGDGVAVAVDTAYKLLESGHLFLCKDNGDRLMDLVRDPDLSQCSLDASEAMSKSSHCQKLEHLEDYMDDKQTDMCPILQDADQCIYEAFHGCKSDKIRDYVDDFAGTIMKGLPCPRASSAFGIAPSSTLIGAIVATVQLLNRF